MLAFRCSREAVAFGHSTKIADLMDFHGFLNDRATAILRDHEPIDKVHYVKSLIDISYGKNRRHVLNEQ